ncbi:MAG TPA: S-layer homology domain-containing protein [Thermoanaerobaculia bacterium]|jgi:hypothetical protein
MVSFFFGTALALGAQSSLLAAQKAESPTIVSAVQLSPTEKVITIEGVPSHQARGELKNQPPPPPREYLEENEETQPSAPFINDGLNLPPEQKVETRLGSIGQTAAPGTFVLLRDSPLVASLSSSINEPNVGSQGDGIFTTHNWYAETSTNNGTSFSFVNPFSTFPSSPAAFSAGFCCDQRVAQDSSRNLIVWYLQYIKTGTSASSTNGVRLAVTHGQAGLASNSWTYYDFTPALFSFPAGTWFDFPQMQASANYLYFTTNIFHTVDDSFYGTLMARISLAQLDSGSSLTINSFTSTGAYFSIMPVNGAAAEGTRPGRTTMYFGSIDTSTSIKVFTWPESSTAPTVNTVSGLASSAFSTFACPGPDGLDPCTRGNPRMQTGWITDSEVGFMWNSSQNGSSRPYPYVRAAILNPSTLAVLSQPDVFNPSFAWLFPAMSVNERGHLGGTIDALGGTLFPTITSVIRDDLSADPLTSGWEVYGIAGSNSGTFGRYGDYNGSMPHEKYPKTWLAVGHTQVGGSDNSNSVVHNYWFSRQRDNPVQTCYILTRTHTGSGSDPSASPANSSGCSSGQYTAGASIQVTASPAVGWSVGSWGGTVNNASTSGTNTVTMPAADQTVTANYVSSPGSGILLVDDDDNSPDVRAYYTAALDSLGKSYQIWDTGHSDTEPGNVALQAYKTVLWFTGVSDTGVTGPGPSGEADLSSFLSGSLGRCLVISSQDYHFARSTTGFMTGYLGLGSILDDVAQTTVQGQGSAFTGLGPYALAYPFTNFSDQISPAAGAELAFSGDQGNAAISRIGPNYRTIFLAFPFEALPTAQARQEVMAAALDYCATVFADVPPKYWARKFIEAIYRAGVTNGCAQNPLQYCPETVVTRGSMAQMLIAAKSGAGYVPPACTTSPFSDVAASDPICPWVQELVHRGVTAGCGGGQYCPNNPVTRSQMSVFLLATWHGAGYSPTPCTTPVFGDVPVTSPFCPWIREMALSGITAGCGGGNFCTESPNTRAQLAVFLATTFHLQ